MFHIICFSLDNLRAKRYEHGCGTIIAQNGSGSKEVVAAGSAEERPDAETVEIYSVADSSWRYGTSLTILSSLVGVQAIYRPNLNTSSNSIVLRIAEQTT